MISAEQIETTDVIVVFDRRNLRELLLQFPQAKDRIVRLGDFQPHSADEIADPFGQSLEGFEDCYRKIVGALSTISHNCWMASEPPMLGAQNSGREKTGNKVII